MSNDQTTLVPHLVVQGGRAAIEFYQKAFGAEEVNVITSPENGLIMHAVLRFGQSQLYLSDAFTEMEPAPTPSRASLMNLNVPDARALFDQAIAAGATVAYPLEKTFWDALYGQLTDPFGHTWSIHQQLRRQGAGEPCEAAEA